MRLKYLVLKFLGLDDDYVPVNGISVSNQRHYLRQECASGWDYPSQPRWHRPDEVRRMRRAEARQMRIAERRRA